MYKIEKIIDECDDDILPEVENTTLGEDYDEIMLINKKGKKQIFAIATEEIANIMTFFQYIWLDAVM